MRPIDGFEAGRGGERARVRVRERKWRREFVTFLVACESSTTLARCDPCCLQLFSGAKALATFRSIW